jgi:tetratricopeptide (TPR) repeat protein
MAWLNTISLNIRLIWSISVFLARVTFSELAQRKLALVSSVAVVLLCAITLLQVTKAVETTLQPPAPLELAIQTEPSSDTYRLSPDEAQEQLSYFLELYKQQPTHREVLLNIGILYETLGNTREAGRYFELAAKNNRNAPQIIRLSEK